MTPTLELHDGVRLRREIDGFPAGTEGAVVQVFPEQHVYGVELFESPGGTIGLVDAIADDLEPSPNGSPGPDAPRSSTSGERRAFARFALCS